MRSQHDARVRRVHVRRGRLDPRASRVKLVFRHRRLPLAHRDGVRPQRADDGRHVPRDVRPLPLLDLGPILDRPPVQGSTPRQSVHQFGGFVLFAPGSSRRVSHRFRGVVGARVVLGVQQSGEIGGGRRRRVGLLERRDEGHEPRQREEERAEENLLGRSLGGDLEEPAHLHHDELDARPERLRVHLHQRGRQRADLRGHLRGRRARFGVDGHLRRAKRRLRRPESLGVRRDVRPAAVAELPERGADVRQREAKVNLRRGIQRVTDVTESRLRGRRGRFRGTRVAAAGFREGRPADARLRLGRASGARCRGRPGRGGRRRDGLRGSLPGGRRVGRRRCRPAGVGEVIERG